jgi:acid phosphatase type 7
LNAGGGRTNSATGVYTKTASGLLAHQGAVYVVAGSSGQVSGGSLNHAAMFVSLNVLGSLVLDIFSNRLDATFIRENGITNDYFTMVKEDAKFSAIQPLAGNQMRLSLTNVAAGKTNIVQASTTLTNWFSLVTNAVSSNSFQFVDVNATNADRRFYRVLRLP